jgi:hypothetical protein
METERSGPELLVAKRLESKDLLALGDKARRLSGLPIGRSVTPLLRDRSDGEDRDAPYYDQQQSAHDNLQ